MPLKWFAFDPMSEALGSCTQGSSAHLDIYDKVTVHFGAAIHLRKRNFKVVNPEPGHASLKRQVAKT